MYSKKPKILEFVQKLSKDRYEYDNKQKELSEGSEVYLSAHTSASWKVLKELMIFKAIDYVLIANYLIIDKTDGLIKDLQGSQQITYEEVIQHLNRILKAKSTVEEVSSVKKTLKNRILVPIIRRKGAIGEDSRQRVLANWIKIRQKFIDVIYPKEVLPPITI